MSQPSPALNALQQFIDDELLRAPLLFDQTVDGTVDALRKAMPAAGPMARATLNDLMQSVRQQRDSMSAYFQRSLKAQVDTELQRSNLRPAHAPRPASPVTLALVDEQEVAVDVELANTIEQIRSVADYELHELQTFVSALVGDMDVAHDHNPLRPETYARALWAAAQALPLSQGHQIGLMRHAGPALAQSLRLACAAASARLEAQGVEPAAYRTLILPAGSRRGSRGVQTTFSPDLHGMRSTMPVQLDAEPPRPATGGRAAATLARGPQTATATATTNAPPQPLPWREVARVAARREDRQAVELVSRLFDAILEDRRLPEDVKALVQRLHAPALRLTLSDSSMLDQDTHPLWRFVNRLAYEAEMAPDAQDPERARLFKVARATIEQLGGEPAQSTGLYQWANERLDAFLQQRLMRRLAALASQVGALQKLEDRLAAGHTALSTLSGALDMPQLDTVPADLMNLPAELSPQTTPQLEAERWLQALRSGDWVRMFIQGAWVRAQLLWPGERNEVWLFGDGASDATWAVRRRALLAMHSGGLLKTLRLRSLLRSAAARVHEQMSPPRAA